MSLFIFNQTNALVRKELCQKHLKELAIPKRLNKSNSMQLCLLCCSLFEKKIPKLVNK